MAKPASRLPSAPTPVRFVLICHTCEHAYEPDLDHLDPAEAAGAGCRRCGGWTWLTEIIEPQVGGRS